MAPPLSVLGEFSYIIGFVSFYIGLLVFWVVSACFLSALSRFSIASSDSFE